MSNTDISLDVRNFPSNGSDGYTNITASKQRRLQLPLQRWQRRSRRSDRSC